MKTKKIIAKIAKAHLILNDFFEEFDSLKVYSRIYEKVDNDTKKIICERLKR